MEREISLVTGNATEIIADYNRRRREGFPPVRFPNLIGRLRGRHVFLIGNSPSLKQLPENWADRLSDPRLFTVGINRAIMWMKPRFWWVSDEDMIHDRDYRSYHADEDGGIVPKKYDDMFDGVRIWWEPIAKFTTRSNFVPWNWGFFQYCCQTADMSNLHKYPESDLFALQAFMGIMVAKRVVLVGIDHATVDGETHYELTCDKDRKKQEYNEDERFSEDKAQHNFLKDGYSRLSMHAKSLGHEIFTVSPVEGTLVRQYVQHRDLNTCIMDAIDNYVMLGEDDLVDMKNWRAFDE